MRKKSRERKVKCSCGKEFFTSHSQGKYCSLDCRDGGERISWEKYRMKNRDKRRRYYREQYYPKNRESIIERTSKYAQSKGGKVVRKRVDQRQRVKFPEKVRARTAVMIAKRQGLIIKQPCRVCGNLKSEAHHEDYTKPLEINWLCRKHHAEHHKEDK